MNYTVVVSEHAKNDIKSIFEYIAYELQSHQSAVGQLSRLEKGILSLSNMPERFGRYNKEPWYSQGLRIMPVDNYCVFYISNRNGGTVNIIRVLYKKRDMDVYLADFKE